MVYTGNIYRSNDGRHHRNPTEEGNGKPKQTTDVRLSTHSEKSFVQQDCFVFHPVVSDPQGPPMLCLPGLTVKESVKTYNTQACTQTHEHHKNNFKCLKMMRLQAASPDICRFASHIFTYPSWRIFFSLPFIVQVLGSKYLPSMRHRDLTLRSHVAAEQTPLSLLPLFPS